jgi:hypothetical protein
LQGAAAEKNGSGGAFPLFSLLFRNLDIFLEELPSFFHIFHKKFFFFP